MAERIGNLEIVQLPEKPEQAVVDGIPHRLNLRSPSSFLSSRNPGSFCSALRLISSHVMSLTASRPGKPLGNAAFLICPCLALRISFTVLPALASRLVYPLVTAGCFPHAVWELLEYGHYTYSGAQADRHRATHRPASRAGDLLRRLTAGRP
jgi:hypothetical protein